MADSSNIVARVETDNYRNTIVRVSLVSDGTGLANYVLVDPTSAAAGAVNVSVRQAGQVFYPGVHLKVLKAYYDVQDMKVRLRWAATANEDALVLGNAPQSFDYGWFGGLRVPAALSGATGQLLISTVGAIAGATFQAVLHLRKNIAGAGVVSGLSISGTPPAATVGVPYSGFTPSVSGGTSPFTFSLFSGSLPTGLSLNAATGAITGTPSGSPGTSSFTLRVTDANSNAANLPTSITVSAAGGSPSLDFSQASDSQYAQIAQGI